MNETISKIKKIIGKPNLLRRLQYPYIFDAMNVKENDRILDLGSGPSWMSQKFSKLTKQGLVIGVDIYKDTSMAAQVSENKNFYFVQSDIKSIPFHNESFDKALVSSVIQVVDDDSLVVLESYRVLKKNGLLVITVPVGYPFIYHLYSSKIFISIVNRFKGYPDSYSTFLSQCNSRFSIIGKGYYNKFEILKLLENNGFYIEKSTYTPKLIGGFLFQLLLLIRISNKSELTKKLDFILYPILFLEKYMPEVSSGIELLIVAKKKASNV